MCVAVVSAILLGEGLRVVSAASRLFAALVLLLVSAIPRPLLSARLKGLVFVFQDITIFQCFCQSRIRFGIRSSLRLRLNQIYSLDGSLENCETLIQMMEVYP